MRSDEGAITKLDHREGEKREYGSVNAPVEQMNLAVNIGSHYGIRRAILSRGKAGTLAGICILLESEGLCTLTTSQNINEGKFLHTTLITTLFQDVLRRRDIRQHC